jgi:formamidopyrimidine-DNA glycosylase
MPELPDVENFRRYLQAHALKQRIIKVSVRDDRVLAVSSQTLRRRLKNRRIETGKRYGKYLFAELDNNAALVFHFGMTGKLTYATDEGKPAKHDCVVLHFHGDHRLSYYSRRKIGTVTTAEDRDAFIEEKALGPDALAIKADDFHKLLDANRMLKPLLMDQNTIAGLGNVYTDEILFQARVHPGVQAGDLGANERKRLFRSLRHVLRQAAERGADSDRFPRTWLTPHRKRGARCPRCGAKLKIVQIGGRTTFYCPHRQRQ